MVVCLELDPFMEVKNKLAKTYLQELGREKERVIKRKEKKVGELWARAEEEDERRTQKAREGQRREYREVYL